MTTITANEAHTIMNAICYTVIKMLQPFATEEELTTPEGLAALEETTRKIFTEFCETEEIHEIEDEADSDIPDDVDETNYNPYMGCDDYEDNYTFDDLGANWY